MKFEIFLSRHAVEDLDTFYSVSSRMRLIENPFFDAPRYHAKLPTKNFAMPLEATIQ